MKKLKYNVRVTVADSFSDALLRLYKASSDGQAVIARDTALAKMFEEVEGLSAQLTTAIKANKTSTSLEEVDNRRDEQIRSLFMLISAYSVILVKEKKAEAAGLMPIVEKYKGITSENHAQKSSLIESMLEDLSDEKLALNIERLEGIPEAIRAIRAAQDEFNKASDKATAAIAARAKSKTAYEIKKLLLASINEKIVPYITAMTGIDEAYADFSAKADIEVAKANASISKKKAENEETEDEEEKE